LEEGLAIARTAGHRWATGYALFTLGQVKQMQGEDERAACYLEESLLLFGEVADRRGMAYAQVFLAEIARAAGNGKRFEVLSKDALTRFGELRDAWGILLALVSLALAAVMNGEPASGARLFGAADAVARATGASDPVLFPQNWGRNKQALHEASLTARAALGDNAFDSAWSMGRGLSLENAVEEALSLGRFAGSQPGGERATPGAARQSADHPHQGAPCAALTRREQEIVVLIARGLTSRKIARVLAISVRTADAHAEHIRDKLRLRSRTEIAAWAVRRGLLDTSFGA
jgi:non-specific serine/threonine protein kinase